MGVYVESTFRFPLLLGGDENWVILACLFVAILDEFRDNLGMSANQLRYVLILGRFLDSHALLGLFDDHLDFVVMLEDLGKKRIAKVNARAGLHSFVHGGHMFLNLAGNFRDS